MKRSYKQNCSLALTADLLCERWTLLIFRELLIRPCRFKELNQVLDGMGTNLLSNRLKELEIEGFIQKQDISDKRTAYELTAKGIGIEPIIFSLINWGHSHLKGNEEFKHQDHWDLLAMRALYKAQQYSPHAGASLDQPQALKVQIQSQELTAWCIANSQELKIGLGEICNPDLTLPFSLKTLQSLITNKHPMDKVANQKALKHFLDCF